MNCQWWACNIEIQAIWKEHCVWIEAFNTLCLLVTFQVYHILLSSWILFERNNVALSNNAKISAKLLTCFALSLTLVLVSTPRDAPVHEMGRIILVFVFAGSFIYVFYAGSVGRWWKHEVTAYPHVLFIIVCQFLQHQMNSKVLSATPSRLWIWRPCLVEGLYA